MIRVVAFDFDGTLVDSNSVKYGCMRKVVASFECGPEELRVALSLGGDRYPVFAEVARGLDPEGASAAVVARGRALAAAYMDCCARGALRAGGTAVRRRQPRGYLVPLIARLRSRPRRLRVPA